MKTYLMSYSMRDGSEWGFQIAADSFEDANLRLAQIRANASLDGEAVLKVPVPGFLGRMIERRAR